MPATRPLNYSPSPLAEEEPPSPPDLLLTSGDLWHEQDALDMILPVLAYAFQDLRANFPILDKSEISLLLTDSATLKKLNLEWRGKDKSTNVLSFPQKNYLDWAGFDELQDNIYDPHDNSQKQLQKQPLGDIAISFENCDDEAKQKNINFYHHLAHLFLHGFLHLLGGTHENDKDAMQMQNLEIKILAKMAIANPYLDPDEKAPLS